MRHSFENKLNIINQIKSGYSLSALCKQQNIAHHLVKNWLIRYDKYGLVSYNTSRNRNWEKIYDMLGKAFCKASESGWSNTSL